MELKPCPFCGNDAKIVKHEFKEYDKPTFYTLICKTHLKKDPVSKKHKCILLIPLTFESEEEAAEAWNNRAD